MRELLRGLLDLLAPPVCAGCRAALEGGAPLCHACDRALPRLQRAPLAPAPLAACVAAAEFRGAVEPWIHRFKYPRSGLAGLDTAAQAVRSLADSSFRTGTITVFENDPAFAPAFEAVSEEEDADIFKILSPDLLQLPPT